MTTLGRWLCRVVYVVTLTLALTLIGLGFSAAPSGAMRHMPAHDSATTMDGMAMGSATTMNR